MYTSCYDRYYGDNAVSIAGRCPVSYHGREYKKLAPKLWFFNKYKKDGDEAFYIRHYIDEVLKPLNAREVYKELGEDAVLLCWEPPGQFCHRHIVVEWFKKELGIKIREWEG